ncbi:Hypothetical protein FKW44_014773 [Caligus rogercresseyi]|uniref:Uncharacterized protein n=1 Tax=Caligus rogercresseyi TaxID=217165 RepID=A0A7T8H002_CALRO|nr:Hypothetical protein FKW44_014773 [Caligus rogercresseyi]
MAEDGNGLARTGLKRGQKGPAFQGQSIDVGLSVLGLAVREQSAKPFTQKPKPLLGQSSPGQALCLWSNGIWATGLEPSKQGGDSSPL